MVFGQACHGKGVKIRATPTGMNNNDFVPHHGNIAMENYDQLEQGALIFHYADTTPLRLTGADRHDFLHGQISNDVKGLQAGQTNSALMLNYKGHALALMQVFRREDDIFVAVAAGADGLVKQQLEQHIIFDQVNLQDLSATISHYSLQGVQSETLLRHIFKDLWVEEGIKEGGFEQFPWQDGKVLITPQRRSAQGGFDIFVLQRDAQVLLEALQTQGASVAGEGLKELARVEAGNANVINEAKGVPIPQEAGLEKYISYHKGCYLGQEIMARLEARVISQGKLRRGLARVHFAKLPEVLELRQEGKVVGHISTLVAQPDGTAMALAILKKATLHFDDTILQWEWL